VNQEIVLAVSTIFVIVVGASVIAWIVIRWRNKKDEEEEIRILGHPLEKLG
jgi:hypothetical protein